MELIKILKYIDKKFPQKLMATWDHAGLQILSPKHRPEPTKEVSKVLIALDLTDEIVMQALEKKVDLIITRHPFLFGELKSELENPFKKRAIAALIENGIDIFSIHTNYDASPHNALLNIIETHFNPKQIKSFGSDKEGYQVKLKTPKTKKLFLETMTNIFESKNFLMNQEFHNLQSQIKEFVIVTGSGGDTLMTNKLENNVFITGDLKWHEWLYTVDNKIPTLVLGHDMESYFVHHLSGLLKNSFPTLELVEVKTKLPYMIHQ